MLFHLPANVQRREVDRSVNMAPVAMTTCAHTHGGAPPLSSRRNPMRKVFNIIRAFQEAGVCGAALCLTTAASECLSCGLIDSPAVLGCLRSLSVALDGATTAASGAATGRQRMPAQDACLGAAGLVVACAGKVMLPPGFAESMFDSLRKAAAHRRGADSGFRAASLLALGSMVGCPLLGRGEFAPRCVACVRVFFSWGTPSRVVLSGPCILRSSHFSILS